MRVFRLQDDEGRGPYSIPRPSTNGWGGPSSKEPPRTAPSYTGVEWRETMGMLPDDAPDPHPAPFEDGIDLPYWTLRSLHFGFATAQSLIDWFIQKPHDPDALHRMGLEVWEWDVSASAIHHGAKQVAFPRAGAPFIRRTPIPAWARRYRHLLPDEVLR